ncbi:MAG: peptidoglycan-binding domain-containing protein [Spartobacteria bacterium]
MKKFITLLLTCSLTLAASVMAQDESPNPKKDKAAKAEVGAQGATGAATTTTTEAKPAGKEGRGARKAARAEAKASGQATGPTGATGPTTQSTDATGKGRGGKGKRNRADVTGATGPTGVDPNAAGAVNGSAPTGTTVDANAKGKGGRGKRGRDAANANKPAATAAPVAAATATAAPVAAASASPTPAAAVSATAPVQTNTAVQSNTAASTQVIDPNSADVQKLRKGKVQKVDQQTVLKIKTEHESFRAQARPNIIPTVTFNQNYRIEGSDRWQGERYTVFRSYRPEFHDQGWYQSRYSRVEIIGGGAYYFNSGYWYPAWGYNNSAQYYAYDGPIYAGRRAVPPDRVIADVQAILQSQGYYRGEVDGLLGPLTRQALAAYQADAGLTPTAAIDEPTLDSLDLA